ncbi:hypothetical protein V8F33_005752 [Rhypophila sp. PSN 637]
MDPLAITGSSISLVFTIYGLIAKTRDFVGKFKEAESDVRAITGDLEAVTRILQSIADNDDGNGYPLVRDPNFDRLVDDTIAHFKEVVTEVEACLWRYSQQSFGSKVSWAASG